jgi:hypothetical protein
LKELLEELLEELQEELSEELSKNLCSATSSIFHVCQPHIHHPFLLSGRNHIPGHTLSQSHTHIDIVYALSGEITTFVEFGG